MVDEVEALLRKYTKDLRLVISRQLEAKVTAAVRHAFTGASVPGTGRSAASTTGLSGARGHKQARAVEPAKPKKAATGRRSAAQIANQTKRLLAHISKNPGQRSEQIAEATKISTGDLSLPLKKLLAEKKIKSSGVARGTTYTPVK